jgi:hypothetical protein
MLSINCWHGLLVLLVSTNNRTAVKSVNNVTRCSHTDVTGKIYVTFDFAFDLTFVLLARLKSLFSPSV